MRASAAENKVLIVQLGGLTPLIRQMLSPNVEVQCNAVGCITNLATHEENKAKIARSGALGPLTRLAKSKDMRVQRNATGALLNMTHSGAFLLINHFFVFSTVSLGFGNFQAETAVTQCAGLLTVYLDRREPATAGQRWRHPRPCPAPVFSRCRRPILLYDRPE